MYVRGKPSTAKISPGTLVARDALMHVRVTQGAAKGGLQSVVLLASSTRHPTSLSAPDLPTYNPPSLLF